MKDAKDISVVVCTMNAAESIEKVLKSILKNNPLEVILVDASSTDGTREIAEAYVDRVVTDPRKGLAVARNIGVKEARGKYIFFCGPDNELKENTLTDMKTYMIEKSYVGVGALTELKHRNRSYWTQGSNHRWAMRFFEGERSVIGTPYMYETAILAQYQYSDEMTWSDDSEICYRIVADGHKIGYSNVTCYEIGVETFKSLKIRYRLYGLSDHQYYKKFSGEWSIFRKCKSALHPVEAECILPLKRTGSIKTILYYLPFYLIITFYRYQGWLNAIKKDR